MQKTIIVLAVLLLAKVGLAAADDPCKAASSTSDARFELAVKDGRTTFQEGEIIPLVLSFSSAVKDRYWADDRSYDRSGRLETEVYCVEPAAPDPLESYFKTGFFMGGGLFGIHKLDTPLVAGAELNEWHRLAPGHYRVYAISHDRVWRTPGAADPGQSGRVPQVLRSNAVEFDVVAPDPVWQSEQIRSATAALNSPSAEVARHAARILRFLDSPESTRRLAQLFGRKQEQTVSFELMFGLYGSPFRKLAVDTMHNEIAVPDHAITADFVRTLANLQALADPALTPSPTDPEYWAHTSALMKAETDKVVRSLDGKVGYARAETLNGLLAASGSDPALAQTIRPALVSVWPDLSEETASFLIRNRWPLLKGPDMLPNLRRIVALPPPPARTAAADTRDAALRHILELDPETGRTLILRDALDRTAAPSLSVVGLLPADDVAAVAAAAVQRIGERRATEFDFELLDRFADVSALSVVKKIVEASPGLGACGPPHVLRYLLRVDPAYGSKLAGALLNSRTKNACYKGLLQSLGDQLPKVQGLAVEALEDPDQDLVQDALRGLRFWGAAGAEAAVWARLKRFHEEWAGREGQLRATPDNRGAGSRGVSLEQSLVSALAEGVGWICTPEKLALLADLASTTATRQQIVGWSRQWSQGSAVINASWFPEDSPTFSVLQYGGLSDNQLAIKLAQFPRGTHLLWQFWKPGDISPPVTIAAQEAVFERMRDVAEKHGVTLDKLNYPQ